MAKTTPNKSDQIINEYIAICKENCRGYLPKAETQKNYISRVRSATGEQEPTSLEGIDIPNILKNVEGRNFVLLIILVTAQNLKLLVGN